MRPTSSITPCPGAHRAVWCVAEGTPVAVVASFPAIREVDVQQPGDLGGPPDKGGEISPKHDDTFFALFGKSMADH